MITDTTPHYAAFISYAHADEAMAARLHKALETYPVPRHLRSEGAATRPIFRDVAELTAAHSLSEKIRDAVNNSRILIVLCSPAAKASHWVNEEIKLFREIHGEGAILSALIEGTPVTSFPEALIQDGREPLAASLGASKTGFRLGVTQLAAGMLGTGLDDLVQRGAKRRSQRMGLGLAASLAFSAVMGFTAFQAVDARNEAELERSESEALLEYMVTDLKVKLEPVGRLELLEGVGRKAIEYYDKKDIDGLSDDSLRVLAAARQVIAQVALDAGRMGEAQREIEASAVLTREVLARNPENTDAIYAHAQSEYFVGDYYRRQGKLEEMKKPWREYNRLAQVLYKKDPTNFNWVMEAAWGQNNLGIWAREHFSSEYAMDSLDYYSNSISFFEKAIELKPESKLAKTEHSNAMSGKGKILLALNDKTTAENFQINYLKNLENLTSTYPDDYSLKFDFIKSQVDYYLHYFLEYGTQEKEFIYVIFDELFTLTTHDHKNMEYRISYLDLIFENTDIFTLEQLVKRKNHAKMLISDSQVISAQKMSYYTTMLQIMDIRIDKQGGRDETAQSKLLDLNEISRNVDVKTSDEWRIFYALYNENSIFGYFEPSQYFAERFLAAMNFRSDLNFPRTSFYKVKANAILKRCKKANSLAQNLRARDYLSHEQLLELYCS